MNLLIIPYLYPIFFFFFLPVSRLLSVGGLSLWERGFCAENFRGLVDCCTPQGQSPLLIPGGASRNIH